MSYDQKNELQKKYHQAIKSFKEEKYKEAVKLFEQSSNINTKSLLYLSYCYEYSLGVSKNIWTARDYYELYIEENNDTITQSPSVNLRELQIIEEYKKYIKEILRILENIERVVFDKNYNIDSIDNNRDKDIIFYENFKIIIHCKYREKVNIRYPKIESLNLFIKTYHNDHIGVMVTNKNYSKNAIKESKNMNIIIYQTQNSIKNIKKEIKF
ncbi:10438_t:CDS:2 [Cetraspora pellucida]|uniref:10438_t:CDS:1 n=1 Tax=Cetraspora pellucida TaxID=1433469 RepID=A0A9N9NTI3_9GLOM|nr:10438_t:CDS:2 [Cetraspora pellucida]